MKEYYPTHLDEPERLQKLKIRSDLTETMIFQPAEISWKGKRYKKPLSSRLGVPVIVGVGTTLEAPLAYIVRCGSDEKDGQCYHNGVE